MDGLLSIIYLRKYCYVNILILEVTCTLRAGFGWHNGTAPGHNLHHTVSNVNGCKYLRDLTWHALGASNRSTVQCRATQGRPLRTASHLSLSIIVNVQGKLELITGIPASNQILSLLNSQEDTRVIAELNDDSKPLDFYGLRDWQVIKVEIDFFFFFLCWITTVTKVIDKNPSATFTGQLTDVAQVEKFELTESEYAKRQG